MGVIYRAKDVNEAILYASSLKTHGTFDWFRGQLQNYRLKSSFTRLNEREQEGALEKAGRFEHWVKNTPGLDALAQSVDAFFAVAQHYGLPTNYVDFTTNPEIAGFFAVHNPRNRVLSGDSCIMCLNTAELREFWESMPPRYTPPEFIQLEVPNLWRLESQDGCFLFCPYGNFEAIYDLDRILFPSNGPTPTIPLTRIYPERKSALEILLDQFFMNERLIEGTKEMEQFPAFRDAPHVVIPKSAGWSSEFCQHAPPVLDSWMPDRIRQWLESEKELFSRVSTESAVTVELSPDFAPLQIRSVVKSAVLQALSRDPLLRAHLVRWEIRADASASRVSDITAALERLWDGVRILAYSGEQVADSIGQCVALWVAIGNKDANWVHVQEEAADACFAKSTRVEFGSEDGSYSKGFASRDLLLTAVRSDIERYLDPALASLVLGNLTGLLQAIQDPRRLFEFSSLADVFVRQLAPSQVLFRDDSVAIFYSPARVDCFGLP
jgi:hypothetical protein